MTYFLEVFRLKFQIYGYCYLPLPLCCCLDDINCIFINTFMARTLILLFYIKISLFTKKLRKTFSTTTSLNMKQNWYHLLPSFLHLQKFKHVISIVEQKTDLEWLSIFTEMEELVWYKLRITIKLFYFSENVYLVFQKTIISQVPTKFYLTFITLLANTSPSGFINGNHALFCNRLQ